MKKKASYRPKTVRIDTLVHQVHEWSEEDRCGMTSCGRFVQGCEPWEGTTSCKKCLGRLRVGHEGRLEPIEDRVPKIVQNMCRRERHVQRKKRKR